MAAILGGGWGSIKDFTRTPWCGLWRHHPNLPKVVYAGTDKGLYRSDDVGVHWNQVDSALSNYTVWALAIDAQDPNIMYAGTGHANPGSYFPNYRRR